MLQFAAFGRATVDGKVLHGHNLMFPYASLARFLRPTHRLSARGKASFASVTRRRRWGVLGMNAEVEPGGECPRGSVGPAHVLSAHVPEPRGAGHERARRRGADGAGGFSRGGSWNSALSHRSGASMVWEQVGGTQGSTRRIRSRTSPSPPTTSGSRTRRREDMRPWRWRCCRTCRRTSCIATGG